jgi:dehydrogenase/reductase SDR family member 7B
MHPLREKVVLVTGASSGIGRATAERLGDFGCRLTLAARDRGRLDEVAQVVTSRGGQAEVLVTDVTDAGQVERAVTRTVERFGRLDIAIASAGLSLRAYFENTRLDALEQVMRVNFFGTLYVAHHALPHLIRSRGSLVGLSSLTGKRGIPQYAGYGASKFAVQGLFESLGLEVARHGVHVGVVAPAFVGTPLRQNVLAGDGKPWPEPPPPPFRVWPVEKCVERILRLLVRRQKQALIPWFTGPMLLFDDVFGRALGDRLLSAKFPPL